MKLLPTILLAVTLTASAQTVIKSFPSAAVAARTVTIVNNTHQEGVTDGATDAIKRWGRFTIVDDPDIADITLVFDKKSEHQKTSTQKTGDDGKPESSFSMTFSSSIHMHASVKGTPAAFYSTTSGDSKKKAGEAASSTSSTPTSTTADLPSSLSRSAVILSGGATRRSRRTPSDPTSSIPPEPFSHEAHKTGCPTHGSPLAMGGAPTNP